MGDDQVSGRMETSPAGSNASTAIDGPQSPFFMHYSDNPGLTLVSQLLTGDDYVSWSRSMKIALSVKNKLGFIDGTITRPPATDGSLLHSWLRNNNIVIAWLLNSVSKEISKRILYSESAFEIWCDLRERFQQSNAPRIFQLRRELINLRQGSDSLSLYFTKLKSIWEEITKFQATVYLWTMFLWRIEGSELASSHSMY